jgi:hypothetical protein
VSKILVLSAILVLFAGCNSSSTTVFIPPAQALYVNNAHGMFSVFALPFSSGAGGSPIVTLPVATNFADDAVADFAGHLFELNNSPTPPVIYQYARPIVASETPTATIAVTGLTDCVYLTVDAAGNLWVSCLADAKVVRVSGPFTTTGSYSGTIGATLSGGGLGGPRQLTLDIAGDLFVADGVAGKVWIYKAPVQDGNTPTGSLTLSGARGVAVDAAGNVYAVSFTDSGIRRWNTPSLTTFNQAASVDDPAATTGLSAAYTLSFDASGNLYVGTCAAFGGSGTVALFSSASLVSFSMSTEPAFTNTTTGCAFSAKVTLK